MRHIALRESQLLWKLFRFRRSDHECASNSRLVQVNIFWNVHTFAVSIVERTTTFVKLSRGEACDDLEPLNDVVFLIVTSTARMARALQPQWNSTLGRLLGLDAMKKHFLVRRQAVQLVPLLDDFTTVRDDEGAHLGLIGNTGLSCHAPVTS